VQPALKEFKYNNLPDGIYYFKANAKTGPSQWSEAGVFRVRIDSTPPESFEPTIATDPGIYNGSKFVSFSTVDKTSGISHYMVRVGTFGKFKNATSPMQLQRPVFGSFVYVKAFDNAGNETTEKISYPGLISQTMLILICLILIGLILIALLSKFKKRKEVM
jgi:hypothetical protein